MSSYVVDSSVLLAIINNERGRAKAEEEIDPGSFLSAVNLLEVVSKLQDFGWAEPEIESEITTLDLEVIPLSASQAFDAGFLRNLTRDRGLSLGDRACFALARELALPVLTADLSWATLDLGVDVRLIR